MGARQSSGPTLCPQTSPPQPLPTPSPTLEDNEIPGFGKGWPYPYPDFLNSDVGVPLAPYSESGPDSQVFVREYTKASVQFDCNVWKGTVTLH